MKRLAPSLVALLLVIAACSDGPAATTTTSTTTTAPTTTTEPPTTTTTSSSTTTTTVAETTTTEATEDTVPGEETTTTTTIVEITTASTLPPPDAKDALIPWAGLFRQPTSFGNFLDLQSNGTVKFGPSLDTLDTVGSWDYREATSEIVFTGFDFGEDGCGNATGRYLREAAPGGGRRLTLVDDPCEDRATALVQMVSPCRCMTYLRVAFDD